eukprot:481753_1
MGFSGIVLVIFLSYANQRQMLSIVQANAVMQDTTNATLILKGLNKGGEGLVYVLILRYAHNGKMNATTALTELPRMDHSDDTRSIAIANKVEQRRMPSDIQIKALDGISFSSSS